MKRGKIFPLFCIIFLFIKVLWVKGAVKERTDIFDEGLKESKAKSTGKRRVPKKPKGFMGKRSSEGADGYFRRKSKKE